MLGIAVLEWATAGVELAFALVLILSFRSLANARSEINRWYVNIVLWYERLIKYLTIETMKGEKDVGNN